MRSFIALGITIMFTCLALLTPFNGFSQQAEPVSWETSVQKIDNQHVKLLMKADIKDKWHLYTQNFDEGGPIPLYFKFEESNNYELVGDVKESPDPVESYDEVFEVNVKYQEGKATYSQKIKILSENDFTVKGLIDGQACYDDGQCVLVSKDISFDVKGVSKEKVEKEKETDAEDKTETESETAEEEKVKEDSTTTIEDADNAESDINKESETKSSSDSEKDDNKNSGLFAFILIAIGGGLAGVLTPCVFPMIPMTVSFFMQGNSSRSSGIMKALVFGISIMLLYTLVGLIVSLTSAGADLTTTLSTSWIANAIFFILFMVFAFSFFGMFEIVLPSSLANKADQQVDKGGILASFFMALTLVIVSFSCTGPIVGALLVKGAASGSWLEPTLGMAGFGFGFALPFTLLAASPRLLKKLPKSGGWMNSVKVVFAFILLAFSMKFLSNIDQAYNLNFLSRDIYLSIWIVLFFLLGFYLLGKIKFSHDTELKHISVFRLLLVIISFTFAVYLIPGLFGANLSSISAVIPPKTAQKFDIKSTSGGQIIEAKTELCDEPKHADFLHYPDGIQGYFDYDQALSCAKEQDKPLLLYFTGHSCSNCKKMQASVWEDSRVIDYFNNEFIIAKLYTDERKELPEEEWVESEVDGKTKKSIGKINLDRQIRDFNVNSQPLYVIIDPETEEVLISDKMKFETNPDKFIEWLDRGIDKHNSK